MTGAEKDWYWIRRGVAGALVFGTPLVVLQQIKAEEGVRQALEDAGHGEAIAWLRTNAPWLGVPADVEPDYALAVRPDDADLGQQQLPQAHTSSSSSLAIPALLSLHVPVYGYSSVETPATLADRARIQRQQAAAAANRAAASGGGLEQLALQREAEEHRLEAARLEAAAVAITASPPSSSSSLPSSSSSQQRHWSAFARQAQDELQAPGQEEPGKRIHGWSSSGISHAVTLDACTHLDEEREHTSAGLHTSRHGKAGEARRLMLSPSAEEAARLRLQAVKQKLPVGA